MREYVICYFTYENNSDYISPVYPTLQTAVNNQLSKVIAMARKLSK